MYFIIAESKYHNFIYKYFTK